MAIGIEDIQIMLSIFVPVTVIIIVPLIIYFHRNGIVLERIKIQIENLCHCMHENEKDRDRLDAVHADTQTLKSEYRSLDRRVDQLEQNQSSERSPIRSANYKKKGEDDDM